MNKLKLIGLILIGDLIYVLLIYNSTDADFGRHAQAFIGNLMLLWLISEGYKIVK